MAFWNKKKNEENAENTTAEEEVKTEKSDLDLIKEAMEEAKEERHSDSVTAASEAEAAANDMPTPEEIKHAQEIIAKAQASNAAKAGNNAPVNTASLKAVVNNFLQVKNQENMKQVMDTLQNPQVMVCVPAQIITSKENQEKMKQGGEVKLEGPIKINPMIFTDNKGKKVLPIFSGEDVVPDDIKQKSPKVNMPFGQVVNILKNIKEVDTIVLDPYTANIRIGVNIEEKPKQS